LATAQKYCPPLLTGRKLIALDEHDAPVAVAESFFATLKTELIYRRRFITRVEAREAIFDFIETFYNSHRWARCGQLPEGTHARHLPRRIWRSRPYALR
jgi:hypothetical protein